MPLVLIYTGIWMICRLCANFKVMQWMVCQLVQSDENTDLYDRTKCREIEQQPIRGHVLWPQIELWFNQSDGKFHFSVSDNASQFLNKVTADLTNLLWLVDKSIFMQIISSFWKWPQNWWFSMGCQIPLCIELL